MTHSFQNSDAKPKRRCEKCENRFYRELVNWFMFPWQLWVQKLGKGDRYIQCIDCLIHYKDIRFHVKCQFLEIYALLHYIDTIRYG